jgi:hypothetical protein
MSRENEINSIPRRTSASGAVGYSPPVILHESSKSRIKLVPFYIPHKSTEAGVAAKIVREEMTPKGFQETASISLQDDAARRLYRALGTAYAISEQGGDGDYVVIRSESEGILTSDIPALAQYFLEEFCTRNNFRQKSFGPETLALLARHTWQGNARELRNAVERMAILTPDSEIGQESVPLELREPATPAARNPLHQVREDAEREQIRRALWATGGNVSASARMLGLERTNLHKRIKALGLARDKQEATATN